VVAVRALKNKGSEEFGELQLELLEKLNDGEISRVEAQYKVEEFWAGALRRAVQDGDIESGSLMAGQSVGLVDEVKPVKQLILDLVSDADSELKNVKQLLV